MIRALALSAMLVAAPAWAHMGGTGATVTCGGETTRQAVDTWFADLRDGLAEKRPVSWFNRFVEDRLGVVSQGKFTSYPKADLPAVTPKFITLDDWRQIAAHGSVGLEPVGWRGCLMDNGKVWFQADASGLRLSSINRDMEWSTGD